MPTTSVAVHTSSVAVHTISFRGKAGVIFGLLAASLALYVVGFATANWSVLKNYRDDNRYREGLWERCTCDKVDGKDWLHAVQAMMSVGLIGLLVAILLITIYLCVHTVSKNSTIIALVCVCFISVVFMLIGFIIYGVEKDKENYKMFWSFGVSVAACVLCFIAGIVAVVQMRKSGVRL